MCKQMSYRLRTFGMHAKMRLEIRKKLAWNIVEAFAEKIRRKLIRKGYNGGPPWSFRVCCFIDCTVIQSCRPGSGPASGGVGAPRYNNYIQMAFYNGWKRHHGTKWQSIESPIGVCIDMFGPRSFRRCDLNLLISSNINTKLAQVQAQKPVERQKCLFGDGIYPADTHLLSRAFGDADGMASIRFANEWDYVWNYCKFIPFHQMDICTKVNGQRRII